MLSIKDTRISLQCNILHGEPKTMTNMAGGRTAPDFFVESKV